MSGATCSFSTNRLSDVMGDGLWIAILAGLFGLIGSVVGSIVTSRNLRDQLKQQAELFRQGQEETARLQRERQDKEAGLERERHAHEERLEREKQARLNSEQAAARCEIYLARLQRDIPAVQRMLRSRSPEFDRGLHDRVQGTLDELTADIIYLTEPTRTSMKQVAELLRYVDDFAIDGPYSCHYENTYTIVRRITSWGRRCLAALLNNEQEQPWDPYVVEYHAALKDYYNEKNDEFAEDIAESKDEREKWLARHPDVAKELTEHRDEA